MNCKKKYIYIINCVNDFIILKKITLDFKVFFFISISLVIKVNLNTGKNFQLTEKTLLDIVICVKNVHMY